MSGTYYTDEEIAGMEAQHAEVCAEVAALKARCEALEKDAARYRWLKSDAQRLDDATQILPECFDSYIDSMMASSGADGGGA